MSKKAYEFIDISNGTIYVFDKKSELKKFVKTGELPKSWKREESKDNKWAIYGGDLKF